MDPSALTFNVFVQLKTTLREFKSAEVEKTDTELIIKQRGETIGEFQRAAVLGWWKEPEMSPAAVAKLADRSPEELEYLDDVFSGREPKMKLVPKEPLRS
jgi:hypothetical protein